MEGARAARADDLAAIAQLAKAARDELAAQRGGPVWRAQLGRPDPVERSFSNQLGAPAERGSAVVGTIDATVVGYGISSIEVLGDGSRLAVVSDLYVDPEARGVGIGEAMMDLLVDHARSVGARGIDALALPGDRATKNFFETFGLKARAIIVHRALDGDDGDA
ncbi:MAG: GNAT family N-acetyltransferase [Acidimicrobiales bacterium]|nr:GNAT family N-acetyltransferase [Acidimicrobiales bacterium]HRW38323.1 GNAT family N-acetyltransferase [Aquihabitans sp.]